MVLPETLLALAAGAGALLLLGGGVAATAVLDTAGELLGMFLAFPRALGRLVLGMAGWLDEFTIALQSRQASKSRSPEK